MTRSHAAPEDPAVTAAAEAALANYDYSREETTGAHAPRIPAEAAVAAVESTVEITDTDGYVGRRRAPEPEAPKEPARAAHTAEAPATSEIVLWEPIPEDKLKEVRKGIIREHLTEPQIAERMADVRKDAEPRGGYFALYIEAIAKSSQQGGRAMGEAARAAALAKPAEDRTDFDDFMLGQTEETRRETRDPRHSYYRAERRVVEALQDGRMPEEFRDVESLEPAIAYMIERGLADLPDRNHWRRSVIFMDAAEALREATLRVPGFNPVNAGLNRLYDRSILMAATLRAESSHWGFNRAEHGSSSDWMAGMVWGNLAHAEDAIAALYLQGRRQLLTPEAEPATV
jgi:hypothetical protein